VQDTWRQIRKQADRDGGQSGGAPVRRRKSHLKKNPIKNVWPPINLHSCPTASPQKDYRVALTSADCKKKGTGRKKKKSVSGGGARTTIKRKWTMTIGIFRATSGGGTAMCGVNHLTRSGETVGRKGKVDWWGRKKSRSNIMGTTMNKIHPADHHFGASNSQKSFEVRRRGKNGLQKAPLSGRALPIPKPENHSLRMKRPQK